MNSLVIVVDAGGGTVLARCLLCGDVFRAPRAAVRPKPKGKPSRLCAWCRSGPEPDVGGTWRKGPR